VTRDERAKIVRALAEAEDGTTGRIGVRIVPDSSVDAFERAGREFKRAGLHRHENANAALILVAPNARRFAIVGDRALHQRVGDAFWQDVVKQTRPYLERGEVYDGIVYAIGLIGKALHAHFAEPQVEGRP
jgi:uncharacterized membrane protein